MGVSVAAVLLTVAVIVVAFVVVSRATSEPPAPDTGPLAIPAAPAPGADGRWCGALDDALPRQLADQDRRELANPSPGVAAWGSPAVILRCGLPDPAELTCASHLTQFTDKTGASVSWLQLSDESSVTYIAVDRPVRIAVTLPPDEGVAPVQHLSEIIAATIPAAPICTDGHPTAPDND